MENASKALIMAGSVLLSMLIIGALVFMFNSLSNLKDTEASSEEAQKLAEYNKQIETFNREGVYGSEILSLANLIEDYNLRQSDLKGYTAIILEVYTNGISAADDNTDMQKEYIGTDAYKTLVKDFEQLQDEVNTAKSEVLYGQTVEKLAGLRTEAIIEILQNKEIEYSDDEGSQMQEALKKIDKKISNYTSKKSEMTEFKNKKFRLPQVEYDDYTGRVTKMVFKEISI